MANKLIPTTPQAYAPVEWVDTGSPYKFPTPGIALCLSGGGYRAMLFHLGVLWRLNEVGYLEKIERVSSVSGGSITAAMLGYKWSKIFANGMDAKQQFVTEVVEPIRRLAGKTIDARAILGGAFSLSSIGGQISKAYRQHLFGKATLQTLPDKPRFVINATNVQSGVLWRFMKPYMRDYRVGEVKNPDLELAIAVAASSAFPPFLSPVKLKLDASTYTPNSGKDLQYEPFTTNVVLTDGGVYDNLGLETAWKRYDTILVSDAGGHMEAKSKPKSDWARHTYRVFNLIDSQVRALRKRQVIESFELHDQMLAQGHSPDDEIFKLTARKGAYWNMRDPITDYDLTDALPCPSDKTTELATVPTRLKRMKATLQERLINWGYASCDAALRKHVDSTLPVPDGFPYPIGVG